MIKEENNVKKTDKESMKETIEKLNQTVVRLTMALKEKDKKIDQLTIENLNNIDNSDKVEKFNVPKFEEYEGDDDLNKKIVKLYAQGYSSGFIYEILNRDMNTAVRIDTINDIVESIEGDKLEIDNKLLDYYIECKKLFESEQSLSKGFFASMIYKKLQILEENYSQCLIDAKESEDTREQRMILDSILKLTKEKATIFSKNILDIFENNTGSNTTHSDEYKNLKNKYLEGGDNTDKKKKILKIKKKG